MIVSALLKDMLLQNGKTFTRKGGGNQKNESTTCFVPVFLGRILKQKTSRKAKDSVPNPPIFRGKLAVTFLGFSYDMFRWGGGDSGRPSFAAAGRDPHDTWIPSTWRPGSRQINPVE